MIQYFFIMKNSKHPETVAIWNNVKQFRGLVNTDDEALRKVKGGGFGWIAEERLQNPFVAETGGTLENSKTLFTQYQALAVKKGDALT